MIKQAVISVAGEFFAQKNRTGATPPTLLCLEKIGGLTLLKRNVLTAAKAGVEEVLVLSPASHFEALREELRDQEDKIKIKISVVTYPDSNLFTTLAAFRPQLQTRFLIMRAEEIYSVSHLTKLISHPLGFHTLRVGVREKGSFSIEAPEFLKSMLENSRQNKTMHLAAVHISCLDCEKEEWPNLKIIPTDCHKGFWGSLQQAEEIPALRHALFESLRKPTDGWIRRHLNRRISLSISRVLCNLPFSANHITGLGTLLGILSGFLVASGTFWQVFLGGFFFQLFSIFDGVDGEISRLKLTNSSQGEWFDTICDNITYLAFFIGVVAGLYNQGYTHLYLETGLLLFGLSSFLILMFYYLLRYTKSGSLTAIQSRLMEAEDLKSLGWVIYGISKLKFMMKRDFFSFIFMSLAMMQKLHWILHLVVIGTNVSWMVLLFLRQDLIKIKSSEAAR